MTVVKCVKCGKRASKNFPECKACYKVRIDQVHQEAKHTVMTGRCPQCGFGIRRNLALTGWYQCEQYGADGFRKDSTKPACSWQTFTE